MELLGQFWQAHWMLVIVVLSVIAFIAGFVDSIAGGGGLFLVPGFLLIGLPPQLALGQEKIVSTLGTVASIRNFLRENKIVWKVVVIGIPFALLGAYIGTRMILLMSPDTVGKVIVFLIPIGILLFLTPKNNKIIESPITNFSLAMITPLVCFIVGFYDGFFGPGTGSMFILSFHYLLKLDLVTSSANTKIFNFSSNAGALAAFLIGGKVLYLLSAPLILTNIIGNHVGSKLILKKGSETVRRVLVFSMIVLFISLVAKYFIVF